MPSRDRATPVGQTPNYQIVRGMRLNNDKSHNAKIGVVSPIMLMCEDPQSGLIQSIKSGRQISRDGNDPLGLRVRTTHIVLMAGSSTHGETEKSLAMPRTRRV